MNTRQTGFMRTVVPFRWIRTGCLGLALLGLSACQRGDVLVAERGDIQITFSELRSTYNWDGGMGFYPWQGSAGKTGVQFMGGNKRKLFGKPAIGNLRIDGSLVVDADSGYVVLTQGSRMYHGTSPRKKWLTWPYLLRWLLPLLILLAGAGTGCFFWPAIGKWLRERVPDTGAGRSAWLLAVAQWACGTLVGCGCDAAQRAGSLIGNGLARLAVRQNSEWSCRP